MIKSTDSGHEGPITVLLLMSNTLGAESRSGIHRVAIELARCLGGQCTLWIVKWDDVDGQLRFASSRDLGRLLRGDESPPQLQTNSQAGRVNYRFGDLLPKGQSVWLINPEIAYHKRNGNEVLGRIISQCREYGVRVASIFYDLIPICNPEYSELFKDHEAYLNELVRCDLLVPISNYASESLLQYLQSKNIALGDKCSPILLPEGSAGLHAQPDSLGDHLRDTIVILGTVEPRKRQIEFLRALRRARTRNANVAALRVLIVGSLHPGVATEFRKLVEDTPNVSYVGYCDDAFITAAFNRSLFSAFVSNDEGFGLPIVESLSHGVPCLCANFGSMAEIAAGGGCLAVDVNDPDALEAAIITLVDDAELRNSLLREIHLRKFRTWKDYASDIIREIEKVGPPPAYPAKLISLNAELTIHRDMLSSADTEARILVVHSEADRSEALHTLSFNDKPNYPPRIIVEGTTSKERIASLASELGARQARAHVAAESERIYRNFRGRAGIRGASGRRLLQIVISTFNRSPFVAENVRWLLNAIEKRSLDIIVVVVDNASSDDTESRLSQYLGHPNFEYRRNSANVGMLGNLRVCSNLLGSEYLWIVGDDDFIVPDQLDKILAALLGNAGVPLACVNFSVYHRQTFGPDDRASICIAEGQPLAPDAAPSGLLLLREVAEQHDNIFTAIYPIIWRSDVVAACFNYPFNGTPFTSLIESVPTTKILLETYSACEVYWHSPVGVVGNAHNSWTIHRPRWHGVLMQEVIVLARESGVDPAKLYKWASLHVDLFKEAVMLAKQHGEPLPLTEADVFATGSLFAPAIAEILRASDVSCP